MHRGKDDSQSPWLYQFLLNSPIGEASDCLEPKRIKVLRHVAGPFEDGSVRKQISDGDLFMDALFSLGAITSGVIRDDSQLNWDCCDLLLKRYRIQYETLSIDPVGWSRNCEGQMVLTISGCCLVTLTHGLTLKEHPSYCMSRPELQKKLQNYRRNSQPAEGSCLAESSLAISLLMAQMSDDVAAAHTQSQLTFSLDRLATFCEPPCLEKFMISDKDQLRLAVIEEWLHDYCPVEETPTLPSSSCSEIAIQADLPSQVCRKSPTPLPTSRSKTLCDASVQVTFCMLDPLPRPTMADIGVEVGNSLLFNTQSIADRARANECSEGNLPVEVPCSAPPPPVLVPCVQDFPPREEMWSSGSSLRLSCDEEADDLRPDPNLEMLGQKLASSDSSENMTVDDESQFSISPSRVKIATASSSRIISIPGPSKRRFHLEESTLDPVMTGILCCSDPERLDPVIRTGANLQFIQSTQVDYLSSQHCPIEPDFPLSPVMRSSELEPSTQSFEPFVYETAPVDSAETVPGSENFPCVGNIPHWATVSHVCESVVAGVKFSNRENVPISGDDLKGGNVSNGRNIFKVGNVPHIGNFLDVENVVESGNISVGGNNPKFDSIQKGQSGKITCSGRSVDWSSLPDMLTFGSGARECGAKECGKGDDVRPSSILECVSETERPAEDVSIARIVGHIWISSARQPCQRGGVGEMEESGAAEKFEGNTTCESCAVEKFGEDMIGESRAVEKFVEKKSGESIAADKTTIENPDGERSCESRDGERGTAKNYKKTDNVRRDERSSNIRRESGTIVVRTEDVRENDDTRNDDPAVRTKGAKTELNMSPCRTRISCRQLIPATVSVPPPLSVSKKTVPANVSVRVSASIANQDSSLIVSISDQLASASVSVANQQGSASVSVANQQGSASVSVANQQGSASVSVANQQGSASVSVANQQGSASVSVANQQGSASVSVANQQGSARVSVSEQMTSARESIFNHLTSANLVSHRISGASPNTGRSVQLEAARSDLRINLPTLTTSSVACTNMFLPVSVTGTTSSPRFLVGCSKTLLANNHSKHSTKSSCPPDIVTQARGKVPCVSKLGCTFPTSKPLEEESEEAEMDSFDELLILSAESSKLHAELEPSDSSAHNFVDPVKNSAHKLQSTSVSAREKATERTDEVATNVIKQKSGEKKSKKSSTSEKGSRLSLGRRRDPTALFAKRGLKKLPNNRKRKLFNVDQLLERISSGTQTDSDSSNITLEKRRTILDSGLVGNRLKGKAKETDSRKEVDMIGKVTVGLDSGPSGSNGVVAGVISGLKTLSCEIAKDREHTKKSKIKETKVADTPLAQEELIRPVELGQKPHDKSGVSNIIHMDMHLVKNRGVAAAGANTVRLVPLGFAAAEGSRKHTRKIGGQQTYSDGNCKLSEDRSWAVAKDKLLVGRSLSSGNRRSSTDMFTGLMHKPSDQEMPEDTTYPRFPFNFVPKDTESCDKSDMQSCRKDIGTLVNTKSRDSPARNNPNSDILKHTTSNKDIVRDENRATARNVNSRNRETVENSGSSAGGVSSKSGESQTSVPERLTLPTPKNSLPSHQPPRQSIPRDDDQPSPVNGEHSSPKFNRDRIKMLIGRDRMTADTTKAFSCSNLPDNLKCWTFDYFKKWS